MLIGPGESMTVLLPCFCGIKVTAGEFGGREIAVKPCSTAHDGPIEVAEGTPPTSQADGSSE